jgi:hypothetical protein
MSPFPTPGAGPFWRSVLVFSFFLALAAGFTQPLIVDLTGTMLAGSDPLVSLWTVDWLSRHLLSSDMFEGNIFHPFPNGVLYTDISLGTAVLVTPLRLFVRDPVPAYNLAVLLAFAFGGWSFAVLAVPMPACSRGCSRLSARIRCTTCIT